MRIILGLCAFAVAGILIWRQEMISWVILVPLFIALFAIALFFPKQATQFLLKIEVAAKEKTD